MILKIETNGFEEYGRYAGVVIESKTNQGTQRIRITQGEPEDMIFGRNLPMPEQFIKIIKQAYQAGKEGEVFELTREDK